MLRSDGAGNRDELRTTFVEHRTYRRRRLMDVAKLAPVFGVMLFLLPLIWPTHDPATQVQGVKTSDVLIFLVSTWVGMILFLFAFSLAVNRWAVHWVGKSDRDFGVGDGAAGAPPVQDDL